MEVLEDLLPPTILHYCGHRIDAADDSGRFPPDLETHVGRQIRSYLAQHRVGFAYGSLASGADILVAEALLDRGVPAPGRAAFRHRRIRANFSASGGSGVGRSVPGVPRASGVRRARLGFLIHGRRRALRVRRAHRHGPRLEPCRVPRRPGPAAGHLGPGGRRRPRRHSPRRCRVEGQWSPDARHRAASAGAISRGGDPPVGNPTHRRHPLHRPPRILTVTRRAVPGVHQPGPRTPECRT